ncbi:hypothetical protein TNCV_1457361 [Trichonephila clavipes]|nr:hypothetical protein TNCV_1457361 [Trichonephila clavipes]
MVHLRNSKSIRVGHPLTNIRDNISTGKCHALLLLVSVLPLSSRSPDFSSDYIILRDQTSLTISGTLLELSNTQRGHIPIMPVSLFRSCNSALDKSKNQGQSWMVALQRVASHVGIPCNERADQNAKQLDESSHSLDPQKSKYIIITYIGKCTVRTQNTKSLGESLKTHASEGPIPRPACTQARMEGGHLLQCTGLDEYPTDDVDSRYWKARYQMVKKLSMGVG